MSSFNGIFENLRGRQGYQRLNYFIDSMIGENMVKLPCGSHLSPR
jgi:hypothetical protein